MGKKLSYVVIILAVLGLAGPAIAQVGKGNILVEEWINTNQAVNNDLNTLKAYAEFPDNPSQSYWAKKFDRPDGGEDYWGGRFRGYLYPPQTGDYTFWTCSDDDSELWLSTDDDPANVTMIANVEGWMPYLAWDGAGGSPGTNFKSAPVSLQAGKKYYVEALWADGTGGGFLTVGWGGPGIGAGPVIIDGKYLSPVIRDPEPAFLPSNPDPADGEVGVIMLLMQWEPGATALFHDVYFGTDPNPPKVSSMQTFALYYHLLPIEAGLTYYWKVDEIEADGVTKHEGPVWTFMSEPLSAFQPAPADGASGVLPGLTLTWKPGKGATGHHVYFGADVTAVTSGDASVDQGELTEASFNTGALRASSTYYWRVDSVKSSGVEEGGVWSFTTADAGPANKITYENWLNIGGTAVANLTGNANYPDNPDTVEYIDSFQSRVDWADNYGNRLWGWLKPPGTGDYTFWIAGDDAQELWLSTDGSPANGVLIASVPGWTPALDFDNTGGGAGDAAAQESDPIALQAGQKYFIMALGKEGGGGDSTAVAWQGPGVDTREVIKGEYVDAFYLAPLTAFSPDPANGAVDVADTPQLSWNAGEQAQSHDVYFGDDEAAVAAADTSSPLFLGNQAATTHNPGTLEWGKTFYWRIDEVGAAESWRGNVWSFTTANFIPVDDFEGYNDEEGQGTRIYETWTDGWVDPANGTSTVGNWDPPFAEQTIVHGGRQSMPVDYNNVNSPYYAEADLPLAPAQDWTVNGVTDLSLWVHGQGAGFAEMPDGSITMSGAGTDIWDATDEFRYAYKRLNGDGSIVARVTGYGPGSNAWAKGGVMIRETLDGNSKHMMMVLTGGNGGGIAFQGRLLDFSTSSSFHDDVTAAPPHWVKLERKGNTITGYHSADGVTWELMTDAAPDTTGGPISNPMDVTMATNVLIGLAVTSHASGELRTFTFDNVSTTGNVTGSWTVADVGVAQPAGNSRGDLYVTLTDSSNNSATVKHPDAAIVLSPDWSEWKISLGDFAGVNLTRVKELTIGIGDQTPDGAGRIYIDDIRVTKPAPEPAE